MKKTKITGERAITDLKEIFEIDGIEENGYENNGSFGINKQFMPRGSVIHELQKYFEDKVLVDGLGVLVSGITFIYTTFKIQKINI